MKKATRKGKGFLEFRYLRERERELGTDWYWVLGSNLIPVFYRGKLFGRWLCCLTGAQSLCTSQKKRNESLRKSSNFSNSVAPPVGTPSCMIFTSAGRYWIPIEPFTPSAINLIFIAFGASLSARLGPWELYSLDCTPFEMGGIFNLVLYYHKFWLIFLIFFRGGLQVSRLQRLRSLTPPSIPSRWREVLLAELAYQKLK